MTFDAAYLLQEHERRWRPIADARFAPALVVGRGGIETEINVSSLADPHVTEFAGEPASDIEDVVVARRDGEIIAVGHARGGELHRVVGDPDLERHLLRAVEPSSRPLIGEPPLPSDDRGEREREELT